MVPLRLLVLLPSDLISYSAYPCSSPRTPHPYNGCKLTSQVRHD